MKLTVANLALSAAGCAIAVAIPRTIAPTPDQGLLALNATSLTASSQAVDVTFTVSLNSEPSATTGKVVEPTHSGLTDHCEPLYALATSADPSAIAMAKGIEHFLWIFAFGSSLLLLGMGRAEAILLLLILTVAKANSAAVNLTSLKVQAASTSSTTNVSVTALPPVITPAPDTAVAIDNKLKCWQSINGLAYPSPCPTYEVWTTVQGPLQPDSPPGLVCYGGNGFIVPCADVARGAAPSTTAKAVNTVTLTCATYALAVLLGTQGAWTLPIVAFLAAVNVQATPTISSSSADLREAWPLMTMAPNATVPDEKGTTCYFTSEGLAYPSPCPQGVPAPPPTTALPAGYCMRNGIMYQCSETYEQTSTGSRLAEVGRSLALWYLPLAATQLDVVPRGALPVLWTLLALEARGAEATMAGLATTRETFSMVNVSSVTTVSSADLTSYATLVPNATASEAIQARQQPPYQACTADGIVYDCGANTGGGAPPFESSAGLRTTDLSRTLLLWYAPLAGCQMGLIPGRMLPHLWTLVTMNMRGVEAAYIPFTSMATTTVDMVPSSTTSSTIPASLITLAPNLTIPVEKDKCWYTMNGLAYPTACPQPQQAPQIECTKGDITYWCNANSANSNLAGLSYGLLWYAPVAGYQTGLLPRWAVPVFWLLGALGSSQGAEAAVARAVSTSTVIDTTTKYVTLEHASSASGVMAFRPTTFETSPTFKKADACETVYGMLNCALPYTPPPQTSAGTLNFAAKTGRSMNPGLSLALVGGGLLLIYAFRIRRLQVLLPTIFAGHAMAQAGPTSIPLPQLAVNTTTLPVTTVTQVVFVQNSYAQFTPTVTQYIALCTPYCAGVNDVGQCVQVKGCPNAVSSDGNTLASTFLSMSGMMVLAVIAGIIVGRLN